MTKATTDSTSKPITPANVAIWLDAIEDQLEDLFTMSTMLCTQLGLRCNNFEDSSACEPLVEWRAACILEEMASRRFLLNEARKDLLGAAAENGSVR